MASSSHNDALPKIICAICEKPVERIEMRINLYSDEYRFRVWCHSDTDNCRIPATMVMDGDLRDFSEGRAFTTKKLNDTKLISSSGNEA